MYKKITVEQRTNLVEGLVLKRPVDIKILEVEIKVMYHNNTVNI